MRPTAVFRHGEWIPTDIVAGPNGYPTRPSPSRTLQIISDNMSGGINGLIHPSNGRRYDSKKRFRDETRARGCTEVGNDSWPTRKPWKAPDPRPLMKQLIDHVTPMKKHEYQQFQHSLLMKAKE